MIRRTSSHRPERRTANGRIAFTTFKGLPGVGLPRKAFKGDTGDGRRTRNRELTGVTLNWEDVCDQRERVVTGRITDDTLPNGPVEHRIEYRAPFDPVTVNTPTRPLGAFSVNRIAANGPYNNDRRIHELEP